MFKPFHEGWKAGWKGKRGRGDAHRPHRGQSRNSTGLMGAGREGKAEWISELLPFRSEIREGQSGAIKIEGGSCGNGMVVAVPEASPQGLSPPPHFSLWVSF